MTQLPTQITQELSYSRTQPTQVLHNSLTKGLCQNNWHLSYHQFPLLFLHRISKEGHVRLEGKYNEANVFSVVGTVFVWNVFKGCRRSSQHFSRIYAYFVSSYWPLPTLLNAPSFWRHTKSYFFFFQNYSLRPISQLKASKVHAGCLPPREDCIFFFIAPWLYFHSEFLA